ncbi:MAG: adenosine deaminase [Candidatus Margulisbacteria bacterium]|nr:adenosine deaminase [Candidatus Margulisiibacteriota bacterium]
MKIITLPPSARYSQLSGPSSIRLNNAINLRGPKALTSLVKLCRNTPGGVGELYHRDQLRDIAYGAVDHRVRAAASLLINKATAYSDINKAAVRTAALLLPKAALHVHLDGSVRPQTIFDLAKEQGIELSQISGRIPKEYTVEDIDRVVRIREVIKDFNAFLTDKFALSVAVMQTREALIRTARELVEQAYLDGCLHVEARFAPCLHTKKGLAYQTIIKSVLEGLREGEREFGISTSLILCMYRNLIDVPEFKDNPQETVEHAIFFGLPIDLAGKEDGYPVHLFRQQFELAARAGLPITIHAGEMFDTELNILAAVNMGATRIGHGIRVTDLHSVEEHLDEFKDVTFEVCPTSNEQLFCLRENDIRHHPVNRMLELGLNVCINPDNITANNTTISHELARLHETGKISLLTKNTRRLASLPRRTALAGVKAAFASVDRKASMLVEVLAYCGQIDALLELVLP